MEYFKSSRFLILLFLCTTLMIGCIALIAATHVNSQWMDFKEKTLAAGYWGETTHSSSPISESIQDNEKKTWVVRAHEDRIGVFDSNGMLEYVVDVYLITLPPSDQALLKQGIYVSDRERLTSLMEDYTG